MGWIITKLGNSYIFNESNAERSITFESLSISLVEGKIKLEEFGKYVMTLTFSQIDTIGNVVATDIENAYDLIIGLGQPPYPIAYNFDIEYTGTEMFDNYGIEDEATFISFLESQGATDVVVTDFQLTSSRLRCNLSFESATDLFLSNFGINKINNLDSLVNLNTLVFESNQITTIENLDSLVNLTYLDLSGNLITTIENLDSLINLTTLYLSYNQITTIENLDSLVNLTELDLDNNQITTIENLDSLVNLTDLYLSSNQITTAQFNILNSWAILAPINGTINTNNNTNNFNTSTTYTTLLGKGWTIN